MKVPTFEIKLWQLNLLMSLLFVSVLNVYLWQELITSLQPESFADFAFFVSIFILLVLVINLVLTVLTGQKFYKFSYALIFTLSALCFYYIHQYNIVIDGEMIRNVMETNSSEAKDLISLRLFLYLGMLAALPMLFIVRTRVQPLNFWQRLWHQFKIITGSLVAIGLTLYISYPTYASLARNNRQLSHLILPTNFIFAGISYAGEQFRSAQLPFKDISQGAVQHQIALNPKKKVIIMIIGETARADRFSINGYHKETNPKLKNRQLINFKQTQSCGTNTATSLPCLFSNLSRKQYSHKMAGNQANLLDFFKRVGVDVLWRDNNTGCKGLCARTAYQNMTTIKDKSLCHNGECFDEILLKDLATQITANPKDQVIVLHQQGSHGPAYYRRYPAEFEVFKPTCHSVQLQDCSQTELDNSYDNTIVYTDYFIDKTMQLLESLPSDTDSALFYIADHGESLGENNLYLHGTPYMIAPNAQTHVPFFYWLPQSQRAISNVNMNCLEQHQDQPLSHDNIFHSLLGYLQISSTYYQPELDLFSSCQNRNIRHIAAEFNYPDNR